MREWAGESGVNGIDDARRDIQRRMSVT